MCRSVLTSALEVETEIARHAQAKLPLSLLVELLVEKAVVRNRVLGDRLDDWQEILTE